MIKNNKKPTVNVCIPAYNEEANIQKLILSMINQTQKQFRLLGVYVYSDGSTDKTNKIVSEFNKKNPIVHLKADGKRLGKIERLNQIYSESRSDIIFLFDGDVLLATPDTIDNAIEKILFPDTVIVALNKLPTTPRTLVGKLIYKFYLLQYEIRKDINSGNNIHNFSSCAYGIKNDFAKTIYYFKDIYPITKYTYLKAETENKKVKFASNANVYFTLADNTKDYLSQVGRFNTTKKVNVKIFGEKVYTTYNSIPFYKKFKTVISTFIKDPIYTALSLGYRVIIAFLPHKRITKDLRWDTVKSTKRVIL